MCPFLNWCRDIEKRCHDINFELKFGLGQLFVVTKQKLSRQNFIYAPIELCRDILLRPNDIYKCMTLLQKDYYLIPDNGAKKLVNYNMYRPIYDTTTKGLLPNPRQRRQKLDKTISHVYEKMDLFFLLKITHLKFVFVV